MISDIVSGISRKLDTLFGFTIYSEDISQGFDLPCFYIQLLQPLPRQYIGPRRHVTCSFDIQFFPEENGLEQAQCQAAADLMISEMDYITVNGLACRGTKINPEIIDGVLHFFLQYSLKQQKVVTSEELMNELLLTNRIRG